MRTRGVAIASLVLLLLAFAYRAEADGNVATGKELYVERCVLCHGSKGHGWDWGQKVARGFRIDGLGFHFITPSKQAETKQLGRSPVNALHRTSLPITQTTTAR